VGRSDGDEKVIGSVCMTEGGGGGEIILISIIHALLTWPLIALLYYMLVHTYPKEKEP